jgi:hypothetical protein
MEIIFIGHGVEISKQNDKYYLTYDAGEISDRIDTIQITSEEARKAQQGSMEVYKIIIKYQNEAIGKNTKK